MSEALEKLREKTSGIDAGLGSGSMRSSGDQQNDLPEGAAN
jgi:hypothetical protein